MSFTLGYTDKAFRGLGELGPGLQENVLDELERVAEYPDRVGPPIL